MNDLGGSISGDEIASFSKNPATAVVQEIVHNGGKAVANFDDVMNAEKIVQHALKAFGSCDILINSAGNIRDHAFSSMEKVDWDAVLKVHLHGSFAMCHAVWPIMMEKKYGRIINTGAGAGLYGNFGQANYSAAKCGVLGLSNTLAKEGERNNILVNCVVPVAASRMNTLPNNELHKLLNPHHVTPIVAYLSHHTSTTTGSIFEVGGGWYSKIRIQRSAGKSLADEKGVACSAEDVLQSMSRIKDFSMPPPSYPTAASDAITEIMGQGEENENEKKKKSETLLNNTVDRILQRTSSSTIGIGIAAQSDSFFISLRDMIQKDTSKWNKICQSVGARILFEISIANSDDGSQRDPAACKYWLIDCTHATHPATPTAGESIQFIENGHLVDFGKSLELKPKVTITLTDATFMALCSGSLSAEYAYMRGKMKVRGEIKTALKAKSLLEALQ